jgi:hypothetical protein
METDEQEERIIQRFREALNKWKRTTMFAGLSEETDPNSTDRRITEAHTLYYMLLNRLKEQEIKNEQKRGQTGGGEKDAEQLLFYLGPPETWTESLIDRVRHVIMTDLYEYPLTFNTTLIEQFKQEPNFPTF